MSEIRLMEQFSDEDFRRTILKAIRLAGILAAVLVPVLWWRAGWRSAVLFVVGAAISGSGLYEWLRLMTAVMTRMDAGAVARPLAPVMIGFFLRLALIVVVLYVSLRFLDGSVYALAGGLSLGVFVLSFEGLRLIRAWTV